MNDTRKKDMLRLINHTKGRFLALIAIITIGVAFFVGVSGSSYMMGHNVDAYSDETNLKDLTIYSGYGFDDEDVNAVSSLHEIKEAEGSKFVDVIATGEDSSAVSRVHSWNKDSKINNVKLREGRWPENKNEVLAEGGTALSGGFSIGTKIRLTRPDNNLDSFLSVDEVTVVGVIDTPLYINETKENSTLSNQYISTYFYIPEEAFSFDYYTELNALTKDGQSLYAFSSKYENYNKEVKTDLEDLSIVQSRHRRDSIVQDAEDKYSNGLEEYNKNLVAYQDGIAEEEKNLKEAEEKITIGKQQLEDGKKKLTDSQQELTAQYQDNKQLIEQGLKTISETRPDLQSKQQQLQILSDQMVNLTQVVNTYDFLSEAYDKLSGLEENITAGEGVLISPELQQILDGLKEQGIDFTPNTMISKIKELIVQIQNYLLQQSGMDYNSLKQIVQNKDKITSSLNEINRGLILLDVKEEQAYQGLQQLESKVAEGQKQIDSGWSEIKKSESNIQSAEIQLEQGRKTLEEQKISGEQQLNDAKKKLDKAKQDIEDLKVNEWTVLDRTQSYGIETYSNTVDQMAAIGKIFPVFFFLVAALVCLTTMTRMIDEERGQIGILRALGYTHFQCASKYLFYAGLATLIGSVLGSIIGILTFPKIIYEAWKMLYIEPEMQFFIPWHLIIGATVSFLSVMLLTTWYVCNKSMKEVPSQLLRPAAPKLGKSIAIEHIGFIWKRLSFTWKVTIRNLMRYKRRLIMTVIGVGGCTALMVIGFGVRDSIDQMIHLQFDEITHYDGTAKIDDNMSPQQMQDIEELYANREDVSKVWMASSYSGKVKFNTNEETVITQVFKDSKQIENLYTLRTREGHDPITLDNGVVLSEKLSEDLGVDIGDSVTIESDNGVRKKVKVTAITEMYIQHYAFLSEHTYKHIFGVETEPDTMFFKMNPGNSDLQQDLAKDENITSISFYDVTLNNFNSMIKTLDFIVIVLIISSMTLAFVVLGNLTNINISERQREIATLKVLGFRKKEVQSYIYKENDILTILGAFAGLPLGIALHHWIMKELQFSYVMYGVDVMPLSLVLSVVFTVGFGVLVNHFMKKKLENIEMVESLKSVE